MRFTGVFAASITLFSISALASNVVEVTSKSFDSVVGKSAGALVEFYAPWCGHCKNLAPVYEQLADAFSHTKDKALIVKVDADGEGKEAGAKYGVTGYPTLKWFPANGGEPEDYDGGRDLDTLAAFVAKKTGARSKIRPPPPAAITELKVGSFDKVAMDVNKDVLVAFTAPWCGHCKTLKPTLEKIAQTFKDETNCVVAFLDADAAPNKPIAERYEVKSYPTIKFFPKIYKPVKGRKPKTPPTPEQITKANTKVVQDYNGGRSEADLVDFLNLKCNTFRAVGGGLNDRAGRFDILDELVQKLLAASETARQTVYDEASELSEALGDTSAYYLRVMNKTMEGSSDYVTKETKRLASILEKKALAPGKLDEIKKKANILAAFVQEKVEEVTEEAKEGAEALKDKAEEAIKHAKEEL